MKSSTLLLHVSCSTILAAALADLFPDSKLLNFQATENCFICDFTLPFPFEKEMLPLLEDRIRAWVKKDLPFQTMEMIPSNAAQFFEHQGNSYEAAKMRTESDLVSLIRLDHFAGRSPGKPLPTTGGIKFFKLVSARPYGNWIRLIGTAAFSKDELKTQIEQCKNVVSHLTLIEPLLKKSPPGWIWLPRGEALKKDMMATVLKLLPALEQITTPALDEQTLSACHAAYVKATNRQTWELIKMPLGASGDELFNSFIGTADRLFFAAEEATLISFLQIIAKFLRIFTFDFEVVIVGKVSKLLKESLRKSELKASSERGEKPSIEFRIKDSLGRSWTGPQVWHAERVGVIKSSLFYSIERFLALVLERKASIA